MLICAARGPLIRQKSSAPVVAGFSVADADEGGVSTRTITLNGVAGDLLIGFATCNQSGRTFTLPTGWSPLIPETTHASNPAFEVIWGYRKLTESETTSTFSVDSASDEWFCGGLRITGAGSSPIDGYAITSDTTGDAPVSPSYTTTGPSRRILRVMHVANTGPSLNSGYPASTTGLFVREAIGAENEPWCGCAHQVQASAGATGLATWGTLSQARNLVMATIAIAP